MINDHMSTFTIIISFKSVKRDYLNFLMNVYIYTERIF